MIEGRLITMKGIPRNPRFRKSVIIFAIELVLVIILTPVLYVYSTLSQVNRASSDDVNADNITINDMDESTIQHLSGYHNIALFGVDSRDGSLKEGARSDAIIIASINASTKEIRLLSVYRDTCLQVDGYDFTKATHAYAYGGAELAIDMLNTNLDLNITEFATVDFGVLADIIDALGGLDITLTDEEAEAINMSIEEQNEILDYQTDLITESGEQHLDGSQCVAYARIRKIDSDFNRTERQRTVLNLMFEKAKEADTSTLIKICKVVLPEMYTNLSDNEMLSLAKDIPDYSITGSEGWPFELATGDYQGASYVIPTDLATNVSELHQYLFDSENYTVSDTVQQISDNLAYATGYGASDGSTLESSSDGSSSSDSSTYNSSYYNGSDSGSSSYYNNYYSGNSSSSGSSSYYYNSSSGSTDSSSSSSSSGSNYYFDGSDSSGTNSSGTDSSGSSTSGGTTSSSTGGGSSGADSTGGTTSGSTGADSAGTSE